MCGIAGILNTTDPTDASRIRRMTSIQAHRGPDGADIRILPGAVLGHRRLAIIDLSDGGAQPMTDPDGRYVLTFNGEIYNYRELQAELRQAGHRFATESDSEVLLQALIAWGEAALARLVGMFAFCLYDTRTRTALLARDAFGQKPLYYAQRDDGALLFASEVKALLAAGLTARPNRAAWGRYLLHAQYDDAADSVFEGILQLQPGELMRFAPGRPLQRQRWYDLPSRVAERPVTQAQAADELRSLLIDAARLHMRADVPVGVSLSGGLDSSALLACLDLADELSPSLRCLSVDFGGDLSERRWIEAAAAHHGLPSRILGYGRDAFAASIRPMMWHLEGPIGGLMNCALAPIFETARAEGIRVLQDGTGLDEAFGGYRTHHDLYVGLAMQRQDPALDTILADYAANWGCDTAQAAAAARRRMTSEAAAIDGTRPIRPEVMDPSFARDHAQPAAAEAGFADPLRAALARYLHVEKIPRNTRMKDRLSMAFGTELRLPFLDHRLVEYGLSLPPALLFAQGRSKAIVRNALEGAMDDEVRLATKRSIQAPQGAWLMQEPMRSYIDGLIGSESFAARGFFDPAACRAAFDRFCTGADANSFFVWQWINVEEWFRVFVDDDAIARPIPLHPSLADLDSWVEGPA